MSSPDMTELVDLYYRPLYLFALSLCRNETLALDLTQETFYRWAVHGHKLREAGKAKSWLFTTLYREFLSSQRRTRKWPHEEFVEGVHELEVPLSEPMNFADAGTVMKALQRLEEIYRVPLTLFYLDQLSYKEIAVLLEVAPGTVMSRLSRGKVLLRGFLADPGTGGKVVPFRPAL
ncbi:MAG: RNA polymerase sigma factor [Verrucomicrobiaceae bacterium]|nr:MAG: RNA polymerase sigma factor [Verrucomicrobiaceae bacterium]